VLGAGTVPAESPPPRHQSGTAAGGSSVESLPGAGAARAQAGPRVGAAGRARRRAPAGPPAAAAARGAAGGRRAALPRRRAALARRVPRRRRRGPGARAGGRRGGGRRRSRRRSGPGRAGGGGGGGRGRAARAVALGVLPGARPAGSTGRPGRPPARRPCLPGCDRRACPRARRRRAGGVRARLAAWLAHRLDARPAWAAGLAGPAFRVRGRGAQSHSACAARVQRWRRAPRAGYSHVVLTVARAHAASRGGAQASERIAAAPGQAGGAGAVQKEAALYAALAGHVQRLLPVCSHWEEAVWALARCAFRAAACPGQTRRRCSSATGAAKM